MILKLFETYVFIKLQVDTNGQKMFQKAFNQLDSRQLISNCGRRCIKMKKYIYIPSRTRNQLRMYDDIKKKKKMQINFDQLISELITILITRLKKIIFHVYFDSNHYFPTCNLFYLYKDVSKISGKDSISSLKKLLA